MISALAVVSALCALSGTADAVSMSTFGRGSTRLSARAPVPLSPAEAAALGLPERPVAGEPGSHLVRLPRSVGHALHISGGWQLMGAYFTDIAVGSSGSTFRVLVDTGSSNLLLGAAGCDSCGAGGDGYKPETAVACASSQCRFCNNSPGCTECAFQQPFCDASARCGMGVTYGGGSSAVSGYLANDLVCGFGPTCVNTTISAITAESPARSLASNMTGGLLGLAYEYNACNPTCVQTLFAGIVAATGMSNEFAICLTPNKGGRIDMGVVNPASAGAPFKYTPITHEHWYNFAVQSITVAPAGGAQEVPVKVTPVLFAVTNDVIGSFPDSGTTVVLMGPQVYTAVTTAMSTLCGSIPALCDLLANNCVAASALPDVSVLPTINFHVPDLHAPGQTFAVSLPPASYAAAQGADVCLLIAPTPSIGVILGATAMSNYYIHHDRKNKRLGFAPLASCE